MNRALGTMLAFDIETTGLDPDGHDMHGRKIRVTCVCLCNGVGLARTFIFKGKEAPTKEDLAFRQEVIAHLNAAPRLCAFNGIRFDIRFLVKSWGLPASQAGDWVKKTIDVFEASKLSLGKTFSLDRLLIANGLDTKSGSGLRAIEMAEKEEYEELGAYCMQDTRMTYLVTSQSFLALPFTSGGRRVVLQTMNPEPFVLW
jgi:hypothetical protein